MLKSHASSSNIPLIVLTISAEDQDIAEAYRLGCNSYILKPVEFNKFMDVIFPDGNLLVRAEYPRPLIGEHGSLAKAEELRMISTCGLSNSSANSVIKSCACAPSLNRKLH